MIFILQIQKQNVLHEIFYKMFYHNLSKWKEQFFYEKAAARCHSIW